MVFEYLAIGLVILCCIVSSITDIKSGLIKNRNLLYVCIPAIACNIVSFVQMDNVDYSAYITSLLMAIFFSSLFYFLKIWAGGDYKLFVLLLLSIPYPIMVAQINNIYVSILMLALSFAIGYIYLIAESVVMQIKVHTSAKALFVKTGKQFLRYIPIYLAVILFQALTRLVINAIGLTANDWISVAVTILVIILIQKFRIMESIVVIAVLAIADIVLNFVGILDLFSIRLVVLWLLIVLTYLLKNFVEQFNYESIPVCDLKAGMILSMGSSVQIKNMKRSKFEKVSDESLRSRLSEEDVENILATLKGKNDIDELVIMKKIPFSLFISISVLAVIVGVIFNVY